MRRSSSELRIWRGERGEHRGSRGRGRRGDHLTRQHAQRRIEEQSAQLATPNGRHQHLRRAAVDLCQGEDDGTELGANCAEGRRDGEDDEGQAPSTDTSTDPSLTDQSETCSERVVWVATAGQGRARGSGSRRDPLVGHETGLHTWSQVPRRVLRRARSSATQNSAAPCAHEIPRVHSRLSSVRSGNRAGRLITPFLLLSWDSKGRLQQSGTSLLVRTMSRAPKSW